MHLDAPCTQEQFGELVGVSQQSISDHLARDVLQPGQTAGQWLRDYCAHLREHAAGRGADGDLARERTRLAAAQSEKVERQNKIAAGEYAPVSVIEQVLAVVGRCIVGALEPLPTTLHRRCPEMTAEQRRIVQIEVSKACDLAANASIESLAALDAVTDEQEPEDDLPPDLEA